MAQGVITGHDIRAGNENREGSEVNDRKRAREDGSPGPSKRRTRSTAKKEEKSALSQQIQTLQVSGTNQLLFLRSVAPDGFADLFGL
jgi:hypothetical protein